MVIQRISFRSYGIISAYHHHYPPSLLHSSLAGSRKRTGLNDQAFPMHCSAKNFLTIRHVLRSVTAFGVKLYRPGQRLNSFTRCRVICLG
jgi:hypothetical protein